MNVQQQRVLFLAIIMTVLMSITTMTIANAEDVKNQEECAHRERVSYQHKAMRHHFNFYYQLLAEKYAPDYVKVWNEVTKEREELYKNYKELRKQGKEIEKPIDEAWLKEHSEIQKQFIVAVEKRDDKKLKQLVPVVIDHQKQLNQIFRQKLKENR